MGRHRDGQPRFCDRKRRYRSYKRAREVRDRHAGRDDDPMQVYRCRACGLWHVGHNPKTDRAAP